jgi:hypothetical protein
MKKLIILSLLFLVGCFEAPPPNINKNYNLVVTTQLGKIDTLYTSGYNVYLYEGNVYRDYMDGKKNHRETIASGVYKFTTY